MKERWTFLLLKRYTQMLAVDGCKMIYVIVKTFRFFLCEFE